MQEVLNEQSGAPGRYETWQAPLAGLWQLRATLEHRNFLAAPQTYLHRSESVTKKTLSDRLSSNEVTFPEISYCFEW